MTRSIRRLSMLALLTITVAACLPRPTPDQLARADYGPYPDQFEEIVKRHFSRALYDPYSAVYEFPRAATTEWTLMRGKIVYGWGVKGFVNARNRFGGYVGARPFAVLIRNGQVLWADIAR